jgi:hypothetical protein
MKNLYINLSKAVAVLIILFSHAEVSAQIWQWAKNGGGNGNDFGRVSCVDASGNVYIGGTFDSPSFVLGSTFINAGGTDVFIAKYNSNGTLLWSRAFGGTANETIGGMCTDPSGNLYICGNFNSPSVNIGTVTPITNVGNTDVFVAEYNSLGSVFWARRDGGAGADDAGGIAYTGSLVVAGNFDGTTAAFGVTTLTNTGAAGTSDIFVTKYTPSTGNPISAIRGGGASTEIVTDLTVDPAANVYLSGYFYGTPTFGVVSLSSLGGTDAFALKLSATNVWTWGKSGGGTTNDYGYGISVDTGSNVSLTGSYTSSTFLMSAVTLTNQSIAVGIEDGFVGKFNSTGALLWLNNIGGSSTVWGNDVENDPGGFTYVSARYSSFSGTTANAQVYKYNTVGTLIWSAFANPLGSGVCSANHISCDANGNIYTTGQIGANGINFASASTTIASAGLYDVFLAKISCISPSITGVSTVCPGTSTILTISGATSYTWNTGATTTTIAITPTASTTYSAIGNSSSCGNANSNTFSVTLLTASINAGPDYTLSCSQKQAITAVTNPTAPLSVVWSPTTNLSSSTVLSPTVTGGVPVTQYTVVATLTNNCVVQDYITITTDIPVPDICQVTVDSLGNNNEIYWEKTLYPRADSFIVYREVSTNIYKRIAGISRTAFSMYTDTNRSVGPANGDPNLTYYKYKIQIRDSCGNYSAMSLWHETIFVQDQMNGNFNWNMYAIESTTSTPVSNYNLKRRTISTGTETLVTSTTGGLANDPAYNTFWPMNVKWFVDAIGFNCVPTAKFDPNSTLVVKTKTKSNQSNDKLATNIGAYSMSGKISVYPNPAKDVLNIDLNSIAKTETTIEILNTLGQQVYETKALNQYLVINTSELAGGVYIVSIKQNDKTIAIKKVVIDR